MDNKAHTRQQSDTDAVTSATEDEARQLAQESAMLDEAFASVAAGRVVPFEAVVAWIESLDTDHELPPPRSNLGADFVRSGVVNRWITDDDIADAVRSARRNSVHLH